MRLSTVFVGFLWILSAAAGADPGDQVSFFTLNPFNQRTNPKWGRVLTDIINHEAPGDANPFEGLITLGHETTHGIHAYIRNHLNTTGAAANGFYVIGNRAVLLLEPKMRKSAIGTYVPSSLRGFRFDTYLVNQVAWDDRPLYTFDEWVSYTNGAEIGVDLVKSNLWTYPWQDGVFGALEFSVYAIATAMAIQQKDPVYFNGYRPFREFLAWNIRRSMQLFHEGEKMASFKWATQDKYLNDLRTSPDAAPLRAFVQELFGKSWTWEVFGF